MLGECVSQRTHRIGRLVYTVVQTVNTLYIIQKSKLLHTLSVEKGPVTVRNIMSFDDYKSAQLHAPHMLMLKYLAYIRTYQKV